jgi:hypothetical protein
LTKNALSIKNRQEHQSASEETSISAVKQLKDQTDVDSGTYLADNTFVFG